MLPMSVTRLFFCASVAFTDGLDDVELVGVGSGRGILRGVVRRFTPDAYAGRSVEPD